MEDPDPNQTTDITIHSEPCDCPPGGCAHFVSDDSQCINRLRGEVVTKHCPACCTPSDATWHQDGVCLRCKAKAEGRL